MIGARWLVLALVVSGCAAPGVVTDNQTAALDARIARLPPPDKIAGLVGTNPDRMLATLGPPILRRRDGMAEVWLYAAGPDCKVDLVYYRDGENLTLALAQIRGETKAEAACLRQIAALPSK